MNYTRETQQTASLIINNKQTIILHEILSSLETCKSFYFNVAFINFGGLQLLINCLNQLNNHNVKGQILTSTYLNFSEPKALRMIHELSNINLKVYNDTKERGFHSKAYIFEYEDCYKIIIGSANITASALKTNIEWNVSIISKRDDNFIVSVLEEFTALWDSVNEITEAFLEQYENFIKELKEAKKHEHKLFEYADIIEPNIMQSRAIKNLEKIRQRQSNRGLVIAATGSGKTYMSAFDVKQHKPKRILFIVHQEEILKKSEQSFKQVLGHKIDTGFLTGKEKNYNNKYIFSTIQTLSRNYKMFDANEFDYIIIDEAHHAGANTYQKVINYFKPEFLLGMSATPERSDGFDIFELFNNEVAIELRLHEAMEENLVTPFHYFGITDIEDVNLSNIKLDDISKVAECLKINKRVDFIIEKMNLYGYDGDTRKCLGFCVNIDHAKYMSDEFNKRGFNSIYLTGQDTPEIRSSYTKKLEDDNDPLEVIFTVDIFNEGIDIPSINQVLMLRPTNSPIIFIQQLGRGLRKMEGKSFLTVLDFIGNHNRAFLIAVALKGSRYYDKDSLKVAVANDFSDIPGNTFIQMDKISKERIIKQLTNENFNTIKYLKEEYLAFKAILHGKTPKYLMDYLKYDGSPNPIKFIRYAKTYYEFLNKVEVNFDDQDLINDEDFTKTLKYLSDMLPLVRPHEFSLILSLTTKRTLNINEATNSINTYVNSIDKDSVLHAMEYLNFDFYDSSQKQRWNQIATFSNEILTLNSRFENLLQNKRKQRYIMDVLHYGLTIYESTYDDTNYGLPFLKLYAQYTMQEVALVSNTRKIHSSFRGSGLLTNNNDYFLFVDLHKEKDIKESINYKDKFINRSIFQWQSPNNTKQSSERGKDIILNKDRDIKLHLFIRKFKQIDNISQPYIYIGTMNTFEFEGNQPITIKAKLEHSIPADLYEELVTKIE